ncbi:MAG TPA: M48 family metallopeptidase [Gammaproteobacteria bacterium]|nr:M48 family metallopeptidase [Gammaproteobacteria bacterium]
MKRLIIALVVIGWFTASLAAAPTAVPAVSAEVPAAASAQSATSFDPEKATAAYMAELSPAAKARSDAYFEGGYWLILWSLLYGIGVAWLLLGTKLSARMRDVAEKITRHKWLQTALYSVQYILLTAVLGFPLTLYQDFFREHQYGLSNQDFGQWMGDQFKGLLVALILGTLALIVVYAVIRKAQRSWWLWGSVVLIVFGIFSATIAPVYIAPLFNTYKALPDSPLKARILSMARANGIPASNVYEFDASKQSKRISANVSGMFGTTRISLNDNLLNRSTPAEIQAVMGHEMGHYVLNHVYKDIVFFGIIIVVGFAVVQWGFGRLHARFGARWGIRDVSDVAGLPLLIALFSVYMFLMTPVTNSITRSSEAEADAFGLNAAREPDGFAQAALQLSEYRKMHPGPVEEFIFFDHPSGWNRIHRAMVWKAEHINDPDIRAEDASAPEGAR